MRRAALTVALILSLGPLAAQMASLAELRMDAFGRMQEDPIKALISTEGLAAARFAPADWLYFRAQCSFAIPDTVAFFQPVSSEREWGYLAFDGASAHYRYDVDFPAEVAFFTGEFEELGTDTLVRAFLKVDIPSPEFREYSPGAAFSPDTRIEGTGLSFSSLPGNRAVAFAVYLSWNGNEDDRSIVAGDMRLAGALESLRFDAFAGAAFEIGTTDPAYRAGATALFLTGSGNALYAECGLRRFTWGDSNLGEKLYALFESRLRWESADLTLSFFSSPSFPENVPVTIVVDPDTTYIGINALIGVGNLAVNRVRGGLSLLGAIDPNDPADKTPFSLSATPFVEFLASDFLVGVRATVRPFEYGELESFADVQISVKAVY